jgi:adenylosuccinate lyase
MREATDLLIGDVVHLLEAVRARAEEHRRTPMMGRTHGVHAEPMTFGLKLALWYAELQRDLERLKRARAVVAVGKVSGAVGTFAHLDPSIEVAICRKLGLEPAPVSSQVIQRDRHAELLTTIAITGASLEKFALEVRGLQKTEIGEVQEPFGKGQKGSSAMPHKRNPIGCEQITGLARLLRGNAHAGLENIALWHERDISHSGAERVILPDSTIALDYMQHLATRVVEGMTVHTERMRRNLELTHGALFSQRALTALVEGGMSRDEAYRVVQENAQRAWDEGIEFRELIGKAAPDLDLDAVFDHGAYLEQVPDLIARLERFES